MFIAKQSNVLAQQNAVQEISVRLSDKSIYEAVDATHSKVVIGEPIADVVALLFVDDSAGTIVPVQAADIDFSTTAGEIVITKAAGAYLLAADDCYIVKYIVQE